MWEHSAGQSERDGVSKWSRDEPELVTHVGGARARVGTNGDESVPVREGRNEVRLWPLPFVQRARSGQPPCKEREVRRRVEAATSASEPSTSTADSARRRLRVRWAPLEAWVDCVIVDRRSFDGGVEQHRLKLLESGEEEWVELSEVPQVEYV